MMSDREAEVESGGDSRQARAVGAPRRDSARRRTLAIGAGDSRSWV